MTFDSKYDILNIALCDDGNSIGSEEYEGLVVMRNYDTGEITGFMLYGFIEKYKVRKMPKFPSEVEITMERDVMPAFPRKYSGLL